MNTDTATNFSDVLLPRLQALLEFSVSSDFSDFYRLKYSVKRVMTVSSYEDFARLPLLEKSELLARPWRERLFMPEEKILMFAVSSGTTGGGPFVIPRAEYEYELTLENVVQPALLAKLGVKRVMTLLAPHSMLNFKVIKFGIPGTQLVAGDIKNADLAAALAGELGVDGLITVPGALERFLDARQRLNPPSPPLKWVSLGGEGLSKAKYAYLRARLPGAHFTFRYGAAEFGAGRFYRCPHLEEPSLFHPLPATHIFEILREDGKTCLDGEKGELVHTDLTLPKALPFIRYRTGDEATLEHVPCPCGNPMTLRLSGRAGFDTFKYAGVAIKAELMEEALSRLVDFVKLDFRLHVYEEAVGGKPQPRLELELIPVKAIPAGPKAAEMQEKLAGILQDLLYLAPSKTLSSLVKDGAFGPLRVKLVGSFPEQQGKPRKIISHI